MSHYFLTPTQTFKILYQKHTVTFFVQKGPEKSTIKVLDMIHPAIVQIIIFIHHKLSDLTVNIQKGLNAHDIGCQSMIPL